MAKDLGNSDNTDRRQWIAGGLTVAFGYAALFTTGLGVIHDPVNMFIENATWQQAPLHVLFTLSTATAGALASTVISKMTGGKKEAAKALEPKGPEAP